MYPSRSVSLAPLVGLAVLVAGCEQPTGPVSAPDPSYAVGPQAVDLAQQAVAGQGVDQHALGQAIPAFGGFFLNHGVPTTYLTDPSRRSEVAQAVSAFLAARGMSPADVQARQARFSYRQLEGFFDRTRTAPFESPGGVFADLDEANNRVTLGVEDEAAAGQLRAAVARMGLPDGAAEVVVTQPIHPVATLRDRFDQIPGGVQIHFGMYLCSIGVIAEIGGQLGFITASHCTNTQGGVEGTAYYQPLSSTDEHVIAIESEDPQYFGFKQNRACPRGAKCRYSDASFAATTGERAFSLGQIARTDPGSIIWNGAYWNITGTSIGATSVFGDLRSKEGRTTGYTTGTVSGSCMDTGVQGSNIVLLCQDFVDGSGSAIVGSGDSGSNVFRVSSGSDVTWWGGLWGGNSSGTMFVYSPASNIESELGSLDVTGTSTPPPPAGTSLTASFTYDCSLASCHFDASASVDATTWSWDFGDGTTGTGETTDHEFVKPGARTVTLTVSDGSGSASATQKISCSGGKSLQCK